MVGIGGLQGLGRIVVNRLVGSRIALQYRCPLGGSQHTGVGYRKSGMQEEVDGTPAEGSAAGTGVRLALAADGLLVPHAAGYPSGKSGLRSGLDRGHPRQSKTLICR